MKAVVFDLGHTIIDFGPAEQALHDTYVQVLDMVRDVALHDVATERRPGAAEMVEGITRRIFAAIEDSYVREELEELDILDLFDGALQRLGFHLEPELVREIAVLEHRALASDEIVPTENVEAVHRLKRQGFKIGLVSNVTLLPEMMREDLENQGLLEAFDVTVFSSEEKIRKPHPRIYQAALTRLGVPAAEAVFVGDRLKEDVRGPKEAGMRAVLTTQFRQEDPQGAAVQPDAVIGSLSELPAVLERLASPSEGHES
jgi:putative hydrolase of the HAD superfamily